MTLVTIHTEVLFLGETLDSYITDAWHSQYWIYIQLEIPVLENVFTLN